MARRRALARFRRAPRRSGKSPALAKAKKSASTARKRSSAIRRQFKGRTGGFTTGVSVVAGGAIGGAALGLWDGQIFGMEPDVAAGVALLAWGLMANQSMPIVMASGIAAAYAAQWSEGMASGFSLPALPGTAAAAATGNGA